jgi:hypothetical protein
MNCFAPAGADMLVMSAYFKKLKKTADKTKCPQSLIQHNLLRQLNLSFY